MRQVLDFAVGFDFLGRLPEEHVGGEGGAEQAERGREEGRGEGHRRDERGPEDGVPLGMDDEPGDDIQDEQGGQQQEEPADRPVTREDEGGCGQGGQGDGPPLPRDPGEQLQGGAGAREVRAGRDDVREDHRDDEGRRGPVAVMDPEVAADPSFGDDAQPGRHLLQVVEHWGRQEHQPQESRPGCGAHLDVGDHPRGIVVRGPGDDAGAHDLEELAPRTPVVPVIVRGVVREGGHCLSGHGYPAKLNSGRPRAPASTSMPSPGASEVNPTPLCERG